MATPNLGLPQLAADQAQKHVPVDEELPDLEHIIVLDTGGDAPEGCIALEDVEGANPSFDVEASVAALQPDDVLTLIYTSGTTGPPKGVQLAHRNLLTAVSGIEEIVQFPAGSRVVSWLPAAHIAERAAHHYLPIVFGLQATPVKQPDKDAWDYRLTHNGDYGIESVPQDFATLTYSANGNFSLDAGSLELWLQPVFGPTYDFGQRRPIARDRGNVGREVVAELGEVAGDIDINEHLPALPHMITHRAVVGALPCRRVGRQEGRQQQTQCKEKARGYDWKEICDLTEAVYERYL